MARKVEKWVTEDGQEFSSQREAEDHEEEITLGNEYRGAKIDYFIRESPTTVVIVLTDARRIVLSATGDDMTYLGVD
jgi:hypothetical protein